MKCPYCGIGISANWDEWMEDCYPVPAKNGDFDEGYKIISVFCPECNNYIIRLQHGTGYSSYDSYSQNYSDLDKIDNEVLLYPKFPIAKQISLYVPEVYRNLYTEAQQVNSISPRASATLSRYLLQTILHEELSIKKKNLVEEIDALEKEQNISSNLITMLQVMRRIANFSAHPKKSTNTNEIVEIEQGESDVMLEIIEELFDYVFVKPKQREEFLKNISEKYGIETK